MDKEILIEAQKLLARAKLVTKAGARHSRSDISLLQQVHDMAVELGAKCNHDEDGPLAGRKLL